MAPPVTVPSVKERDRLFYGLSIAGALAILSSTMAKSPVLVPSLAARGRALPSWA